MAEGLTPWTALINDLDGKRYIRWRWRFFVDENYPGFSIAGAPMPAVLDITIPLTVAIMPLSVSITDGIAWGMISWSLLSLVTGKRSGWAVHAIAVVFLLRYAFL